MTASLDLLRLHPRVESISGPACGWCIDVPWPCAALTSKPLTDAEVHDRAVKIEEDETSPSGDSATSS